VKGIIHAPCAKPAMKPETRDALLTAIAKAREWINEIRLGRSDSFVEIAKREALGERLVAVVQGFDKVVERSVVTNLCPIDHVVANQPDELRCHRDLRRRLPAPEASLTC
jgi:hypothetical protein